MAETEAEQAARLERLRRLAPYRVDREAPPEDLDGYRVSVGEFTYVYNGSLTVNVWRNDTRGVPVNFDAYTLEDPITDSGMLGLKVKARHRLSIDSDPRYTVPAPTRSALMFGAGL